MINWPTSPSGTSNEASFFRRFVDSCKRSTPKAGLGLKATETKDGIILSVDQSWGGGVPIKVDLYEITTLANADYFKAKLVNSSGDATGAEIVVAKSLTGRKPATETIDTFEINYTYSGENDRTASADMLGTEIQVCHPRYTVGDKIVVVAMSNTDVKNGGSAVRYYELSPCRYWCAAPDGYTPPA